MRVVAVTKHGDIDQVRRRRILPDLAIDATEVDFFVEPTANPVVASVGNEMWETADVFVYGVALLPWSGTGSSSDSELTTTGQPHVSFSMLYYLSGLPKLRQANHINEYHFAL